MCVWSDSNDYCKFNSQKQSHIVIFKQIHVSSGFSFFISFKKLQSFDVKNQHLLYILLMIIGGFFFCHSMIHACKSLIVLLKRRQLMAESRSPRTTNISRPAEDISSLYLCSCFSFLLRYDKSYYIVIITCSSYLF